MLKKLKQKNKQKTTKKDPGFTLQFFFTHE